MNQLLMSVVLMTPDSYETIRKTMHHLREQTIRDRIEIVVIAPSLKTLQLDEVAMQVFHSYHIVEVGKIERPSVAKAMAVRVSTASIVAFAEDHCYPDPEWAAGLLEAHEQGFSAVGPLMLNANPKTGISWAGLILNYGCCMIPGTQPPKSLPWHNIAYKREVLLEYGDELASLLSAEGLLLDDLRSKGCQLQLQPTAKTRHVNISLLSSWIPHSFWGGRLFGAMRAQKKHWSIWRRLLYVGGGPLIPLVRVWRTLHTMKRTGQLRLIPRVLPAMLCGLLPHALGEISGYLFGLGNAEMHYGSFEMARFKHVIPDDRRLMFD